MNNYVFLYRTKAADDRDCCAYIDIDNLKAVHTCIDGKFEVHGACYSTSLGSEYANYAYDEVDTILTENQYNRLVNPMENDLFDDIIAALTSEEAENYFEQIIESEREYIAEEYNLSDEEIDTVFNEYYLPYRDRGIIGYVWRNYEEVGREYMDACYNVPDFLENYVDYESFGEDLVNEAERYIELESGWIVEVNY